MEGIHIGCKCFNSASHTIDNSDILQMILLESGNQRLNHIVVCLVTREICVIQDDMEDTTNKDANREVSNNHNSKRSQGLDSELLHTREKTPKIESQACDPHGENICRVGWATFAAPGVIVLLQCFQLLFCDPVLSTLCDGAISSVDSVVVVAVGRLMLLPTSRSQADGGENE
jgi:hypothetical protein